MVSLDPEGLERFVVDVCTALGAPAAAAEAVGHSLVAADLRGHGSHGVMRVPNYVERARSGDIDPEATPEVQERSPSAVHVDGHCAFGQYVGRVATEELIDRAAGGVAVAGVRNATHLGRLGEWAERAAAEGLLFFGLASGSVAVVAPAGSTERRFSTNPMAFGVPTFDALEFPIVLDMATSQTAYGKIRERVRTGDPAADGWTVSASGDPVRDAEAFQAGEGALRPLGGTVAGHKGYGMALIVELFAAFAGDAGVISQDSRSGGNAATFVAIDPLAFSSEGSLRERLASLAAYLGTFESAPDVATGVAAADGVGLFPGEPEHGTALERTETGIPLDEGVAATLVDTARDLDLLDSLPEGLGDADS
ncbi:MAG: Ldh family oxidoreductase [Haloarculaceae archaeon]